MRRFRVALLVGAALALAGAARADHILHTPKLGGCGGSTSLAAPTATAVTTSMLVDEWVPEQFQTTRTVLRAEVRQEAYTAYKTECVSEYRPQTITTYRMVPETVTEMRTSTVTVPVVEQRVVMKEKRCFKRVCEVEKKCEDHGQYVCKQVPDEGGLCDRLGKCFKGLHASCKGDCPPACEPVKMKTVKVWQPCPVMVDKQVSRLRWVTEQVPETVYVKTCRTETRCTPVTVCRMRCVPETRVENVQHVTTKCVPYQATRCVTVCVPHQETVTCTRMVCRKVAKEIPCAPAAPVVSASPCCAETTLAAPADCCAPALKTGLLHRLGHGH